MNYFNFCCSTVDGKHCLGSLEKRLCGPSITEQKSEIQTNNLFDDVNALTFNVYLRKNFL